MKHPASLLLAVILLLVGGVTALFPMGRYIGGCVAAVGVLVFLFPRVPVWLRWVLGVLTVFALAAFVILELPILRDARTDADPKADYIIILGAQVRGTQPSWSMHDRLTAALDYLNTYPESKAVVSGGQGPDEGCSEAEAMQTWLTAQGVAPERILLEDRSESTQENLSNSFAIIAADGGDVAEGVGIVTSEYHLHRAKLMAEALGAKPIGVSAKTELVIMRINYFIREAVAAAYMRVAGVLY
ncbi:MAG: YdcF family protein [Oscillospiraceae bacterium]|nr:YdcF family protein [Oscillospiraceae bacterium]